MSRQITQCPSCDSSLRITELSCTQCGTRLQGRFPEAPLARLSAEHQRFVETFVRCRGVIRDVERVLGVSYPTVRARLDNVVVALEEALSEDSGESTPSQNRPEERWREQRRNELLRQVEAGVLDAADAAEALRAL